jgi:DNA-binding PadR family transcriptional regulator
MTGRKRCSHVSGIRLYILAALEQGGEMHGHQLRQLAEQDHVQIGTDISVGALYGALKRLAAEDLIHEVRTERMGGYPERQIWGITKTGREALAGLRYDALREIVLRADPVDIALSCLDPGDTASVPALIAERIAGLRATLAESEAHHERIAVHLTPLERVVVTHRTAKLRADIAWHEDLLALLPGLLAATPSKDPAQD